MQIASPANGAGSHHSRSPEYRVHEDGGGVRAPDAPAPAPQGHQSDATTNSFHPYPTPWDAFLEVIRFAAEFLPHREYFVLVFIAERLFTWQGGKRTDACAWSQMLRGVRSKGKWWRGGSGQSHRADCLGVRDLEARKILKLYPGDRGTQRPTEYEIDCPEMAAFFQQKRAEKTAKLATEKTAKLAGLTAKRSAKRVTELGYHANQAPMDTMRTKHPWIPCEPNILKGNHHQKESPLRGPSLQLEGDAVNDRRASMAASSTTVAREASKLKRAKPDDENPKKTKPILLKEDRSKKPDPVLEFAQNLNSRHGASIDPKDIMRICREELDRYSADFREFANWEPSRTSSPAKVTKPGAYYRSIARNFGRSHGVLNSIDEGMQQMERARSALAAESRYTPTCAECQGGLLANDEYCDCKTGQTKKELDAFRVAPTARRAAPVTRSANK